MRNRWITALIKTLITVIILHILFLILGLYTADATGWFGLPMIWPHWHDMVNGSVSLAGAVIIYALFFFFGTGQKSREND